MFPLSSPNGVTAPPHTGGGKGEGLFYIFMEALSPGTVLQNGKYTIERQLGQGGFGITYLATQDILDRKVAIKEFFFRDFCEREADCSTVSLGTQSNKEMVERFLAKFIKEAQIISKFQHPNIIAIYDIFRENNTAYYVMEYLEGESLSDMVKRTGALIEPVAIKYIKQVGSALSYIHERNINHLDVKPNNIMLRKGKDEVVLIDFGVAKQYDGQTKQGTTTTPVGISRGYSPAEQYRVNGVQSFSPQSDVYALAATLYKLLTGVTPPEALDVQDMGLPLTELQNRRVSEGVIKAIEAGMRSYSKRTQSVAEFISQISQSSGKPSKAPKKTKADVDTQLIVPVQKQTPTSKAVDKPIFPTVSTPAKKNGMKKGAIIGVAIVLVVSAIIVLLTSGGDKSPADVTAADSTVVKPVATMPAPYANNESMSLGLGEGKYTGYIDDDGKPHGKGKFVLSKGDVYEGSFIHGVAEGENVKFTYHNGDRFEGKYINDKKTYGRYYNSDGTYYECSFTGEQFGDGLFYDANGKKL